MCSFVYRKQEYSSSDTLFTGKQESAFSIKMLKVGLLTVQLVVLTMQKYIYIVFFNIMFNISFMLSFNDIFFK